MADLRDFQTPPATEAPFPAIQVANSFIERFGHGSPIDHLKLQKLAYFAYGWWLALAPQQPPLSTAKPQVWKYGPVFQPIYSAFAAFKNDPIPAPQPIGPFSGAHSIKRDDSYPSQFLDWIWSRYGHFSGTQLSDMTHEVGTPWYDTAKRNNFVVPKFFEMKDDEVRAYFHNLGVKEGFIGR